MIMTQRQFELDMMDSFLNENTGVTRKEYLEAYPAGCRTFEYDDYLLAQVRAGETFRAVVLDKLSALQVYYFRKNFPGSVPQGYLTPEERKKQKELSAGYRAARVKVG